MILLFAILAALQIITESSCRSSSNKVDPGEAPDKLHHSMYPLLDAKAPKEEIKVQVVPYKDYKSINARQGKYKQSAKKSKPDVPLAIILADPKFNNKANRQNPFQINNNKKRDRKEKILTHDDDSESNESHKPIIIQVDRNQFIKKNLNNRKYPQKSSKVKQAIGSHTLRSGNINKSQKLPGKHPYVDIEDSSSESSLSSDTSSASEDTTHEYEEWKQYGTKKNQKGFIPHKTAGHHKASGNTKSYFNPKQHHGIHLRDSDDHKTKDSQSSESSDSSESIENKKHLIEQKSNVKHHRAFSDSHESYSIESHNSVGHSKPHVKNNVASKIRNIKKEHPVNDEVHHKNKNYLSKESSSNEESHLNKHRVDETKIHSKSDTSHSHEYKDHDHSMNPEGLYHTLKRHDSEETRDKHHEKHGISENHHQSKSNESAEGFRLEKTNSESKERTSNEGVDDDHSTESKTEEKLHKSSESEEKSKTATENHNEHNKHIEQHKHVADGSAEAKHHNENERDPIPHKIHTPSEEIFNKIRVSMEESQESNSEGKLHPDQSLDSQVVLRSGSTEHEHDRKIQDKEQSDNRMSYSNSEERIDADKIDSKENHKSVSNKTETLKAGIDTSESQSNEIHKKNMILPHIGEWDASEDISSEASHANGYVIVDEKNLYDKKQGDPKQGESKQTDHIGLSEESASDESINFHHEAELDQEKGEHKSYEVVNSDVPYELITAHSNGVDLNRHHKFVSGEIIEVIIIPDDKNNKPISESHHYSKHNKESAYHDQETLSHNKIDNHGDHDKNSDSAESIEDDSSSAVEIIHTLGSHEYGTDNIDHKSNGQITGKQAEKSSRTDSNTHTHNYNNKIKKHDNKYKHVSEEISSEKTHKRHNSKDYKKKNKDTHAKYMQSKKESSSESSEELKSIEKLVLDSISSYVKKKPSQVDHHATKSYNLSFLFNRR